MIAGGDGMLPEGDGMIAGDDGMLAEVNEGLGNGK